MRDLDWRIYPSNLVSIRSLVYRIHDLFPGVILTAQSGTNGHKSAFAGSRWHKPAQIASIEAHFSGYTAAMSYIVSHQVFILVASRFDETAVVTCLDQMWTVRISVSLVGLTSGLLSGACGLVICPDLTLSALVRMTWAWKDSPLVIIPGGQECAALLLSDPRVHQVCVNVTRAGGTVAVLAAAQRLFWQMHGVNETTMGQILAQERMETAVFVRRLIEVVSGEEVLDEARTASPQ